MTTDNTASNTYDKGDFEVVKKFISNEVIGCGKATSMKTSMYGLSTDYSRYRNKLKEQIKKQYGDKLLFIEPSNGRGEDVVAADCLDGKSLKVNDVIFTAARMIRNI